MLKEVIIYARGGCDYETRKGTAYALIEYKGVFKYLEKDLEDTTTNRCIIEGMKLGVDSLKEPCKVKLVISCEVGLSKAKKNKGINLDLINSLYNLLEERGHEYEVEVRKGGGYELNAFIRRHKEVD